LRLEFCDSDESLNYKLPTFEQGTDQELVLPKEDSGPQSKLITNNLITADKEQLDNKFLLPLTFTCSFHDSDTYIKNMNSKVFIRNQEKKIQR
jgi:hypothetical protein